MMNLTAFLSYVFVTTFTPGPNNIMSMTNANQYGYKKTVKFNLGVFAGFVIIMLLCSYFDLVLFNLLPKIKLYMEILGALYMAYLAYKIIKNTTQVDDNEQNPPNSFLSGLVLQFFNPKVILYGITVISSFIIPYYQSHLALLSFSLFLAFVGFAATSCWAIFGALFQKFLSKYKRPFNITMGVLLLYSAVSIFI